MWCSVDSTPKTGMDIVLAISIKKENDFDYKFIHIKFKGWDDVYSEVLPPDEGREVVGWRKASEAEIEFYKNQCVFDRPIITRKVV